MKNPSAGGFDVTAFRNAAPYINSHRDATFVIVFDGEAVADTAFPALIHDLALLHSLGVRLVLVHGGRPQIEARLKARGTAMHYHHGLRVTDDAALAAVKEAVGAVRVEIEALLSTGLLNTPMSGMRIRAASGNWVTARPLGVRGGVDFCHTGEVRKIDTQAIRAQLELGHVVLLSPLGYSPTGEVFNLSAEEVATFTASSLQADKLIVLMEGASLRDGRRQLIRQLDLAQAQALLSGKRKLPDPVRRHVENAVNACLSNVRRVHLIDRHIDGALLKELYTRDGAGTLITAETYEGLREARIDDAGGILDLIAPLEQKGVVVRRSREQLELEISRFSVIERDGMIVACAGLYPYPEEHVGELVCLAVHPGYREQGRGDLLLDHVETHARAFGLVQLFVLTTHTPHWFRERGFVRGDLKSLPIKRRELYNYQRNSQVFLKNL